MKKLVFILPAIIVGLLLASCNASLTKRHYRKGYFVEHKKHTVKPEAALAQNKVVQPPVIVNETVASEQKAPSAQPNTAPVLNEKQAESANEAVATKKENKAKKTAKKALDLAGKLPSFGMAKPVMNAADEKLSGPDGATRSDALSLFWIVLVVLLVLYLIGILTEGFGLGGIIHLLAVVLVVLLILWLLGIV